MAAKLKRIGKGSALELLLAGFLVISCSGGTLAQSTVTATVVEAPAVSAQAAGTESSDFRSAAMERLRGLAGAGDLTAAYVLATQLLDDTTSSASITEGVTLLKQASDGGLNAARRDLANDLLSTKYGLAFDRDAALGLLRDAAKSGDVEAKVATAKLLIDTDISPAARDEAVSLLDEAVTLGHVGAATTLGGLYAEGRGVPIDAEKAMALLSIGVVDGDSAAMLQMASLLRAGTIDLAPDPVAALAIYNELYAKGSATAGRLIADMYLNGEGVFPNTREAITRLEQLGAGGDTSSLLALADIYARGQVVPIDATRAVDYYERASAGGNGSALLRLADVYMRGLGDLPADLEKGMALYEQAVATGSPSAKRSLAAILLGNDTGVTNVGRGLELLEASANEGDSSASKRLGEIYASNDVVLADYDKSKAYFDRAIALGASDAAVDMASAFAQAPFADDHKTEALALLNNAIESRIPGAASELARLQLAGAFPDRGADGVLSLLLNAARAGDADAARYLVRLYRDGSGAVLQPNRAAAESTLKEFAPLIGAETAAVEGIAIKAAQGQTIAIFEAIEAELAKLRPAQAVRVLRQLRGTNTRAYVFVVQKHLADAGIYKGVLQGTLDGTTIRAIGQVCDQLGVSQECAAGPLTSNVVRLISEYIFTPKNPA